jgi:PleD family two-component response regulator
MVIDASVPEGLVTARSQVGEYEKMVRFAKESIRDGDVFVPLTFSAGLAEAGAEDDIDSLLGRADQALYRAKTSGRDQVVVWEPDSV